MAEVKLSLLIFFSLIPYLFLVSALDQLPPGSLNLTVDPVPDRLLGTSFSYIDLPSDPSAPLATSLPPGIPQDYIKTVQDTKYTKRSKGIYQPDNTQYPYRTIGKVFTGHIDSSGTYIVDYALSGVLVGNSTILLASVPGPWNGSKWFIKFVPVYSNGLEPYGDSYVNQCVGYQPAGINGHDYIVCQLFTPLGTNVGYMGYMYPGNLNEYFNPLYTGGGFPQQSFGGRYLGVQDGISVTRYGIYTGNPNGVLLKSSVFSSEDGLIGGPLWDPNTQRVVAVLSGVNQGQGQQEMSWAGGAALAKYVQFGRANWDNIYDP
jgi:hypothetical protein